MGKMVASLAKAISERTTNLNTIFSYFIPCKKSENNHIEIGNSQVFFTTLKF